VKPSRKLRHRSRSIALQYCYAFDQKRFEDDGLLRVDRGDERDAQAYELGRQLFDDLRLQQQAVDGTVERCLRNWSLARLAVVDRSILRLGCFELLYRTDTPVRVVINEYIELAKEFGSEARTSGLVNGVLDRIAQLHRPEEVKPEGRSS